MTKTLSAEHFLATWIRHAFFGVSNETHDTLTSYFAITACPVSWLSDWKKRKEKGNVWLPSFCFYI